MDTWVPFHSPYVFDRYSLLLLLEYDAVTRLGIPDPKGYCRKRFKDVPLLYLTTCCVGSHILDQIEAAVDEALSTHTWLDVMVNDLFSDSIILMVNSLFLLAIAT